MWALIAKALVAGAMIVAIGEVGRRQPTVAALVASLPLVSVLGMVLLWLGRPEPENMARHTEATFWYVLPSLPMFLVMPVLLRHGAGFWLALLLGCALTVLLYLVMIAMVPRFGIHL